MRETIAAFYTPLLGQPTDTDAGRSIRKVKAVRKAWKLVNEKHSSAVRHPAFPWFGGKWRLANWVINHLPPHRTYVEPFGGAGSVLLRKPPSKIEVYNDIDREVANFFSVMRTQFDALVRLVALSPWHRGEWYDCREQLATRTDLDELQRARLFAVVGIQSFAGNFGGSWGYSKTASTRDMAETCSRWLNVPVNLYAIAERLQRVQIENDTAIKVMRRFDSPETCFYCDPPYAPETRLSGEYRHELDSSDHAELLDFLRKCQGRVVLSGYDCPLYRKYVGRWKCIRRRVACFAERRVGQARSYRTECLWLKPPGRKRL